MRYAYVVCGFAAVYVSAMLASCGDDPIGPLRDPRGVLLVTRGNGGPTSEIYALRPDGSEIRQLTRNGFMDTDPSWSPDGSRIVFVSSPDSTPGAPARRPDIYIMNADGSGARRLFQSTAGAWHPRWSPDGRRIAFENLDASIGGFRVFIMDADGSNVRALPTTAAAGENFAPEWSPDGTRVFFLSNRPPRAWWTIYVVGADGTGERQLSDDTSCIYNVSPFRLSPDGSRIGYNCTDQASIFTMRSDGTDARPLTFPPQLHDWDAGPVWSRDGSQIAFTSVRDRPPQGGDGRHVYVMSASGSNITRITRDNGDYFVADWGPPQ